MADGSTILPPHLYLDALKSTKPENPATNPAERNPAEEIAPLATLEQRYLAWAAEKFPGDRKALAKKLGISERTLYRKLRNSGSELP